MSVITCAPCWAMGCITMMVINDNYDYDYNDKQSYIIVTMLSSSRLHHTFLLKSPHDQSWGWNLFMNSPGEEVSSWSVLGMKSLHDQSWGWNLDEFEITIVTTLLSSLRLVLLLHHTFLLNLFMISPGDEISSWSQSWGWVYLLDCKSLGYPPNMEESITGKLSAWSRVRQ